MYQIIKSRIDSLLRWIAACVLILSMLLSYRFNINTNITKPQISQPVAPVPLACWEKRLNMISGVTTAITAPKLNATAQKRCPALPQALPGLNPKADIATMRHPGLMQEFFDDTNTLSMQRLFVAAELLSDYKGRVSAFTALAINAPTAAIKWRADVGLALTYLRYGRDQLAREVAQRMLRIVTEHKLPMAMAADAHYILALTSSSTDKQNMLANLIAARTADPFFFDANLELLVEIMRLLHQETGPLARIALLDDGLQSIDALGTLDDRGLLIEVRLNWPKNSMHPSNEEIILNAYAAWYTGQVHEAIKLLHTALNNCLINTVVCKRVKQFLASINNASSHSK